MSAWWSRLVCKLKGHKRYGFQPWGGWPHQTFGIRSSCRRCGADTSVAMPSSITITRPGSDR